MVKQSRQ